MRDRRGRTLLALRRFSSAIFFNSDLGPHLGPATPEFTFRGAHGDGPQAPAGRLPHGGRSPRGASRRLEEGEIGWFMDSSANPMPGQLYSRFVLIGVALALGHLARPSARPIRADGLHQLMFGGPGGGWPKWNPPATDRPSSAWASSPSRREKVEPRWSPRPLAGRTTPTRNPSYFDRYVEGRASTGTLPAWPPALEAGRESVADAGPAGLSLGRSRRAHRGRSARIDPTATRRTRGPVLVPSRTAPRCRVL